MLNQIMSKLPTLTSFTVAAFCFEYMPSIIKFKLYYNWSSQLLTIFWRFVIFYQICSPLKISRSVNVEWNTCDRNNYGMCSYFYESKKLLGYSMKRETCQLEKKGNGKNIIFKTLANRFRLTSKLISWVKEQQNCSWATFY